MLAPGEFTVGPFSSAEPGSLILPRTNHEVVAIVGVLKGATTAVLLTGNFRYLHFETSSAYNWAGVIVPGVRIEVDERSILNSRSLGTAGRVDTRLVVYAQAERSFGSSPVTIVSELSSAGNEGAYFPRWRIVLGSGTEKRTLFEVDTIVGEGNGTP